MDRKKRFMSFLLAIIMIVSCIPAESFAAETKGFSGTKVNFTWNGWDKKEVAEGITKEDSSEMWMSIKGYCPLDKFYSGEVYATFCFDEGTLPDGEYFYNLDVDIFQSTAPEKTNIGTIIVKNKKVSFGEAEACQVTKIGKTYYLTFWSGYETEGEPVNNNIIGIMLRTLSTSSKDTNAISLTNISICDSVSGNATIDLSKCVYKAEKHNQSFGIYKTQKVTVEKNGKIVDTSKNKFVYNPNYTAPKTNSIAFDWQGWDKTQVESAWDYADASHSIMTFQTKSPSMTLYSGFMRLTYCFYVEEEDRKHLSEMVLSTYTEYDSSFWGKSIFREPYTTYYSWDEEIGAYISDAAPSYSYLYGPKKANIGNKYYMTVFVPYKSATALKSKKDVLNYKIQLESNNSQNIKAYLTDITVMDAVNGIERLEFVKNSVSFEKYNPALNKHKKLTCFSIEKEGRKLLIEDQPDFVVVGEKQTLKAVSEFYDNIKAEFSSSDKKVATITKEGTLKALKAGKTTITVKDTKNKQTYSFVLTVKNPYFELVSDKTTITAGTTYYLVTQGVGFSPKAVSFKSSNPSVGTIHAKTGLFTAKKPGTTTITVSDSGKYATKFTIKVVKNTVKASDYVTMKSNPKVSKQNQKKTLDYMTKIYNEELAFYGKTGYRPHVEIRFDYTENVGAAAYATQVDENHWAIVVGINTFASGMNMDTVLRHELAHVMQNYGAVTDASGGSVLWLTEGLADYCAYTLLEDRYAAEYALIPYKVGQDFTGNGAGYGITPSFIHFVALHYFPAIGQCLNEIMQKSAYSDEIWKTYTGHSAEELWEQYALWSIENQW